VTDRRFEQAVSLVDGWVASGLLPGAALLIARGDEVMVERYWGVASLRTRAAAGANTLWSIASITKPVTAAAVMSCVEAGRLDLERPLTDHLLEFADGPGRWRRDVTLRHCLTHTSGLAGFSRDNLELRQRHAPIDDFIASFLREDVHFLPGQWHLYSSVGFGLAAEAVGRSLKTNRRALTAYEEFTLGLLAGLGIVGVAFRPDDEQQSRAVWVESTGQEGLDWEIGNSRYYRSLGMPWGGLFAPARAVLRFIQAFLPGGFGAGEQKLSPAARKAMAGVAARSPEAPADVAPAQRDVTWDPNAAPRAAVPWGLGFEVKGDAPNDFMGERAHATTFGHYGASGTMAWADPEAGVAMVLLTNRAWVSRWPVQERRAARLADAVIDAL
jgi:CubicO group peptidase (beta-lactamase class C family)